MHPLVNIGIRAARRAGNVIFRSLNRLESLEVSAKGRNDFVTDVDRNAEQEIIETIRRAYPDHGFLAEESGQSAGKSDEFVWIIDPLDGTTNFLHGFPQFCVSIAVQQRGRIEHAVIYDPMRQELFTASRGQGAQLDDKKMRVSKSKGLEGALIGTGFPYRANLKWLDSYMAMFKAVTLATAGLRRPGSAALDLAWTAMGRYDAYFERDRDIWDVAAGALICECAGLTVRTLGATILAAPDSLVDSLAQIIVG